MVSVKSAGLPDICNYGTVCTVLQLASPQKRSGRDSTEVNPGGTYIFLGKNVSAGERRKMGYFRPQEFADHTLLWALVFWANVGVLALYAS